MRGSNINKEGCDGISWSSKFLTTTDFAFNARSGSVVKRRAELSGQQLPFGWSHVAAEFADRALEPSMGIWQQRK